MSVINRIICLVPVAVLILHFAGVASLPPPRMEAGSPCKLPNNTNGICTPVENCHWLLNNLEQKIMNYTHIEQCSFVGSTNKSIVCCALSDMKKEVQKQSTEIDKDTENGDQKQSSTENAKNTGNLDEEQTTTEKIKSTTTESTENTGNLDEEQTTTEKIKSTTTESTENTVNLDEEQTATENTKNTESLDGKQTTTENTENTVTLDEKLTTTESTKNTENLDSTQSTTKANPENTEKSTQIPDSTNDDRSSFEFFASIDAKNASGNKIEDVCTNYQLAVHFNQWRDKINYNILGGVPAKELEFPHAVALAYTNELIRNTGYEFRCAGVIISEKFVLTAAHCTLKSPPVRVRLGTIEANQTEEIYFRNISKITVHPEYNPVSNKNDIALIELSESLVFTSRVQPACLQSNVSELSNGTDLTIIGWGVSSFETKQTPNQLQKANITAIDLETCNSTLFTFNEKAKDPRLLNGLSESQLCTFDSNLDKDSCEGDSGSPLLLTIAQPAIVVGITSFGVGCGSPFPSVYTKVAHYSNWIESIVWPSFDDRINKRIDV